MDMMDRIYMKDTKGESAYHSHESLPSNSSAAVYLLHMSAARTLQEPTPDAPDPSTPFLDPRRSATLAQIRGRGRGKKHKILKLWGFIFFQLLYTILLIQVLILINPENQDQKDLKSGH